MHRLMTLRLQIHVDSYPLKIPTDQPSSRDWTFSVCAASFLSWCLLLQLLGSPVVQWVAKMLSSTDTDPTDEAGGVRVSAWLRPPHPRAPKLPLSGVPGLHWLFSTVWNCSWSSRRVSVHRFQSQGHFSFLAETPMWGCFVLVSSLHASVLLEKKPICLAVVPGLQNHCGQWL